MARARQEKSAPGKQAAPVFSGPIIAPEPRAVQTSTPIEQDNLWVRLPKPGQTLRALTRSYLYQLCANGKIRSITIRAPHNKRGVRLVFLPSLDAWLASLDLAQNGAREAAQ
jgi:hypothetical protein